MAIAIERVEFSRNPVQTGEEFTLSVTVVTQDYLGHFRHSELEEYTHGKLRMRGMEG